MIIFDTVTAQDVLRRRVQEILDARGIDQKEFARLMGRTQGWASMFLSGQRKGDVPLAAHIALTLGVPLSTLLPVADVGHEVEDEAVDVSGYTKDDIPVIAEGDASPQPNLFWDDRGVLHSEVEDRVTRPREVTDPRAYGVRVRGDSMITRLQPGDIAIVSPNTPVQDGEEVYAQLLSGERLLKVAHKLAGGWLLESYNRAYEPRQVKRAEIGAMHPILWIRSKRRGRRVVKEGVAE